MSRSGYSDDLEPAALGRWRAQVRSATRGKRGQVFFRDLLLALDSMPEKRLVASALEKEGSFCALGALGKHRNVDLRALDTYDHEQLGETFGIAHQLAQEVMYENDERWCKTEEERWAQVRDWVSRQILSDAESQKDAAARLASSEQLQLLSEGKRRCFRCSEIKELRAFPSDKSRMGGRSYCCHSCKAARLKSNPNSNFRRKTRANIARHTRAYPKQASAGQQVRNAVKSGKLEREPCEVCGKSPAVGHHDDYDKPLDVRWLCAPHHRAWHEEHGHGANLTEPLPSPPEEGGKL